MPSTNVAQFMLERLHHWGVRRVFGYPGDGTNGLNLAFPDRPVIAALDRALGTTTPSVLDVVTDPEVPPLPPEIRRARHGHWPRRSPRATPTAPGWVKEALKGKVQEYLQR